MRSTRLCTCTVFLLAAISFLVIPTARAAYTITVDQAGPDVVATGGGSIDRSGLTFQATASGVGSGILRPTTATINVGSAFSADIYLGVAGPASLGSGVQHAPSSALGDFVGVSGDGTLAVPFGFGFGQALGISTATWSSQTISSLGLTPGTYLYTLPNDTVTVTILPEPASLSLLALAGVAMLRRRGRGSKA